MAFIFVEYDFFTETFFNRDRKDVEIGFQFMRCSKASICSRTTNPKRVFIFLKTASKVPSFIVAIAHRIFELSSEIFQNGSRQSKSLTRPQRKQSQGVKSGERADQSIGPPLPIHHPGSFLPKYCLASREQCGIAPSYWTIMSSEYVRSFGNRN